ncbi:hypothetical protein SERLA73DRAFT_48989 [Serpula lacrymans var. lacrymans S7.3]|uniref:Translational machinery component n=1 Tax=Serpula lacrymans var. lacrymans (strain S7.3) TaxID=936435 RepID=F8PR01_SERL3|nr:hypothetical protein SERLA73DRAFT_48989 [Serpula lacrymans var. lacrymans S7.3]
MPPSPPPGSFPNPFRESEKKAKALTQAINPTYYLYVHSSRNNTIVTFTRPDGGTLKWWSGGSCGFKKANRAGYEAGYQCAVRAFAKIVEEAKSTPLTVGLRFKGFGQGREALYKALMASEGEAVRPLVVEVEDRTPIKIGGTRSKKTRRL